jgi:hypothetical protein
LWSGKPFDENIKDMAKYYNDYIEPGHGFFFDFKATPEIKKPLIEYMTTVLGWKLDYKNTFLRKPINIAPC